MASRLSISMRIYIILISILALFGALNVYLPQGAGIASPEGSLPTSKPVMAAVAAGIMLVVYGGLGLLGMLLARRLGFPELWDPAISNRQRLLLPAWVGVGTGVFFILADLFFTRLHSFGRLPHPPFPTSLVASATAGIGEEVIFRLFFIPLWVWLISAVLLRGRWQEVIFWVVAVWSALAFAAGHLPAVMYLLGLQSLAQIPTALLVEIFLLNGVVSLLAAYSFRRFGILAAMGIHFWTDIVWHVVWGFFA